MQIDSKTAAINEMVKCLVLPTVFIAISVICFV